MRGAAGLASIITARYASRSTDSWSPKGRRLPPQDLVAPLDSKCLPYPVVTDPEAPPLRPQRHVPNSIATLHRRAVYANRTCGFPAYGSPTGFISRPTTVVSPGVCVAELRQARQRCRDVLHVRAISHEICAEICDAVRLSHYPGIRGAARRQSGDDGILGGYAARTPIRTDIGTHADDLGEFAGSDEHHAAIRAKSKHRRRGSRR